MRNQIIHGNALAVLKSLPDNYVQCCITSPPYYGLRSYLPDGHPDKTLEIGLEETPEAYITRLVEVFREVSRVLRSDGTLWVNIGDSYFAHNGTRGNTSDAAPDNKNPQAITHIHHTHTDCDLKSKDLIGIPWMLAFALRADGWYLRSDIIWHKPTAMPESVTDRPTSAHEHIFLLAKSERYFYDADAIAEPATNAGKIVTLGTKSFSKRQADGANINPSGNGKADTYIVVANRNKRNVWTINTHPYPDAHFATFPPKLVEPCILAGTSPKACEVCGAPWQRVTLPTGHINKRESAHAPHSSPTKVDSTGWAPTRVATNEWEPTCKCSNDGHGQCIVLDPFVGAGTVAFVAIQHGRDYIGIDLNEKYITLIEKRIAQVQQHLWTGISDMEVPA